jgi:hypothetical protein
MRERITDERCTGLHVEQAGEEGDGGKGKGQREKGKG